MKRIILFLCLVFLSGCAIFSSSQRLDYARSLAHQSGMREAVVATKDFHLTSFFRVNNPNANLTVYIEGDGSAWVSRRQLSLDPTPKQPVGLQLATQDLSANVLYLGRPCQYASRDLDERCHSGEYWSSKRFSQEVLDSVNEAIDHYQSLYGKGKVDLVGYSGGGAVVTLIAARRNDVASIRTVAGNLDHSSVNKHHGVSQLEDSLNAIDVANDIQLIPQIHFVGSEDEVVPNFIAQGFIDIMENDSCSKVVLVEGVGHGDRWAKYWPSLLSPNPHCVGEINSKKT